MQTVTLGKTDLQISRMGFGGIPIQKIDAEGTKALMHRLKAEGINFIDTARGYTVSEAYLGYALEGIREDFVIATKSMSRDKEGMAKDIETSLKNLRTDYIDLYQMHNISPEDLDKAMGPGGALEALQEARAAGKIGHIGLTAHSLDTFKLALELDWVENHKVDSERYAVPNIVPIEGNAEDFLSSEEGTLWQETLGHLDVTAHCFPVLAVEDVLNVGEFLRGSTRIVSGRTFTPEESAEGERLCVISEQVAATSGVTVGDIITLRIYAVDRESPWQTFVEDGCGITNPAAYRFGRTTPFTGEAQEYTVVGIYRCGGAWASVEDNLYAISPNTVFVPKASVACKLSYADQGAFRTVVLHNDELRAFMEMADEAGYEDLFVYCDQGYNDVAQSIGEYRITAGRAMIVGSIIYGIILLLYLILFPAGLERNLILMDSMGATRPERMGHVTLSSFGILSAGTALGCILGALLWSRVVEKLTHSAEVSLELSLDPLGFVQIALGQLSLAMVLIWILSYWMTRPRTLAGRK